jgi:hypothetical protein
VPGTELTMQRLKAAKQAGSGDKHHLAVLELINPQ